MLFIRQRPVETVNDISVNMSAFTGGGPMSELIRKAYRQLRLNLPADIDILEEIDIIAARPVGSATHIPFGTPGSVESLNLTHKAKVERDAIELRKAFNRRYFMECNMLNFDCEELEAEKAFTDAKDLLDSDERSPLVNIISQVEELLKERRYFSSSKQSNETNLA